MQIPTEHTPNLVKVTNIGKNTNEQTLRDFFSFCGKIKDLELEPAGDHQKALIMFESAKAAKTAELLSNALVEDNHIQVEPYFPPQDEKTPTEEGDGKTVSNIMAELLSAGYALGDQVLAKGIAFDHQYGVRDTVQHYYDQIRQNLQQWDEQYHVSNKVEQVSEKAQDWMQHNPTGQKVAGLITQFSQQISDLHNEAKRLVSVRQQQAQSNQPEPAE
ncbi:hypothetical protein BC941DRAFT_472080 [Chlamydoabsidia padenii]|nr:hypothetical protein BC941DRAFT_472080 [Chlamydoabsidia padenii]